MGPRGAEAGIEEELGSVLLDSSVLVNYLRRWPSALAGLQAIHSAGDIPCTCAVVAMEVRRGLRPAEESLLEHLMSGLTELPISVEAGLKAGEWQAHYRARGITLEDADVLIAATAHVGGARLATVNAKDFPMPELQLEAWPAL